MDKWVNAMEKDVIIRPSTEGDVQGIKDIYDYEIDHGLATFDEVYRSLESHLQKRKEVLECGLPHFVAEIDGKVVGYCYAVKYRGERFGYRYTLENSVFLAQGYFRMGIGSRLMEKLIEGCEGGPWRQMIAVIGDSGNYGSIGLHEKFGFKQAGLLKSVGFKLGRWIDSVLMQRELNQGDVTLPDDNN
ncbi:MAG: N-acetyltransferase [Kordiimonadaceae bacterium]|jgi:L-amino acid N-acyltransferase YncA|nr:N-acetyltransferase [Kordiimonadaceae bacterium]MBT6032201.1 N-acetyltransferase [Kordiimonadaceae bacterium]